MEAFWGNSAICARAGLRVLRIGHGERGAGAAGRERGALPSCECAPSAAQPQLHLLASAACPPLFRVRLGPFWGISKILGNGALWVFVSLSLFEFSAVLG